ncbi:MAG TPA: hypothetical protein VNN10_15815 [Dehalococcoidia bacterium]|nr:hypothetical protein [Dehalococcoidia bacterium]
MSTEEAIIAAARVAGSLLVLRWAFVGGVIAVLVDLSDLFMMNLLQLGGVSNYQAFDKWLDQVYMACFLLVALRWPGPAREVSVALYGFRLVGFVAFEATHSREVLVAFPNVFEFWFLFAAYLAPQAAPQAAPVAVPADVSTPARAVSRRRLLGRRFQFTNRNLALALLVLLALKEVQEVAIHWLKVFDSFTAVEAVQAIWDWVTPF